MLAAAFDLAFYFRLLFVIVIIYTLTLYNTEYKTWNKLHITFIKENVLRIMALNVKDLYKCIKYVKKEIKKYFT